MSSADHRFRLDPEVSVSDLADILGTGRRARPHGPVAVKRTWYDTFDQRLRARDWRLCRVVSGSSVRLVLESGGGPTSCGWGDDDPGFSTSLPPPLAERVGPVVEDRVLLPMLEVSSRETQLVLLDDLDKTVARVTLETRRALRPRRTELPPVVTVAPLRGFAKEVRAASRLLGADSRFEAVPDDAFTELLELIGPAPVPVLDLHFTPDLAAGAAVRAVLIRLLEIFRANLDGTVADLDTEFLHDLRVAVRRARSVVKLLGDVLPDDRRRSLAQGLKWLGDLTTPTRDLDVYLQDLAAPAVSPSAESIIPFRQALQRSRAQSQATLAKGLRSRRTTSLLDEWSALADQADHGSAARQPVGVLGAERTANAHRRVIRDGRRVREDSPAESLHDLRKRCKELRYLLEVFASLHPKDLHREVVGELKKLQDCLGSFQDSQVQSEALTHFAAQLMAGGEVAADTIMAMGGLAADLDRRQAEARGRFQAVFDRFDNRDTHRAVRTLLRAMTP